MGWKGEKRPKKLTRRQRVTQQMQRVSGRTFGLPAPPGFVPRERGVTAIPGG